MTAEQYTANLLTLPEAAQKFGMSASTFLRLRRRHCIAILPGKRVHVADVIAALEKERKTQS